MTRWDIIPRGDWLAGILYPGRLTRWDIIPRGDWLAGILYPGDWLAGISHPGEIDTPGYYTLGRLTRRDIIPQGDWLAGISYTREIDSLGYYIREDWLAGILYPREIDSSGYHTPGRFRKIWITRRNLNQNRKNSSVDQAGLNVENNGGRKPRWAVPLKPYIRVSLKDKLPNLVPVKTNRIGKYLLLFYQK